METRRSPARPAPAGALSEAPSQLVSARAVRPAFVSRRLGEVLRLDKQVLEPRYLLTEADVERPCGTVAVLGQDDLRILRRVALDRLVAVLFLPLLAPDVRGLPVDEHHHVCVLLDAARLAQIAELRDIVSPRLRRTGQLRAGHNRYVEV